MNTLDKDRVECVCERARKSKLLLSFGHSSIKLKLEINSKENADQKPYVKYYHLNDTLHINSFIYIERFFFSFISNRKTLFQCVKCNHIQFNDLLLMENPMKKSIRESFY